MAPLNLVYTLLACTFSLWRALSLHQLFNKMTITLIFNGKLLSTFEHV